MVFPEPDGNHINVHTRGVFANHIGDEYPLGKVTPDIHLHDEQAHVVKIDYSPGTMTIFLDDIEEPVLEISVDIADTLELDSGNAWVWFTSDTGGGTADIHDILSWSFSPVITQ